MPENEILICEREGEWLTVRLNRPKARNALSGELIEALSTLFREARDDRTLRGITLRGEGGVFCAGGDLKDFKSVLQGEAQSVESVARVSRQAGELFDFVNAAPQVVLILVEGAAMAGGMGLVCCGDVVAVTEDAKFALTETTLGIPPAQIAPFVVERLGFKTARRLMLTAARFDGREAVHLGLADYAVARASEFDVIEQELRAQMHKCAPGAIAETKNIVLATRHADRESMLDIASSGFARCMLGDEARDGIAAFLEKRKPGWAE